MIPASSSKDKLHSVWKSAELAQRWASPRTAVLLGGAFLAVLFSGALGCSEQGQSERPGNLGGAFSVAPPAGLVAPPEQLAETLYDWNLPPGFQTPWEPSDNPTTKEKVDLGRHLFYDKRLSGNATQSCASCHRQELAFTDGRANGLGSTGQSHSRSSMSLANVGYASSLTWGNPLLTHLERQALVPLFGDAPVEMGLKDQSEIADRLAKEPRYQQLFADAFPETEDYFQLAQVTRALAAFERTLISGRSAYDLWAYSDGELSDAAQRGYALFNSEKFECFHCHGGVLFSDHTHYAGKPFFEAPYHNTGLYNLDAEGSYPEPNFGIYEVTLEPRHMGRHKAPTLRNIALTAPYMHDGSLETLDDVLDHYAAGGRTIESGPHAGVGADNPYKDGLLRPIDMSEQERADVIAFLLSLTDEQFLENPLHADPW